MGQRLVVTINCQGKDLAKIYYHWSAYTYSALLETKKIIDCIYDHNDETEKELQLRLIRFCEENGGGITGTEEYHEHEYIQSVFPNETFRTDGYSRNNGIIAISEKGMNGLQSWSEGDVCINLYDDEVVFDVYSYYENLNEYIEERKEWDDNFQGLTLEEIPQIYCELGYFGIHDIDNIIAVLENDSDIVRYNNEIYGIFC